ncbi:MAG: methylenetetrahydrofolate reductase C-terminal domain-containing protein [Desulfobacterales bacterium]|jgi:ferredoxin
MIVGNMKPLEEIVDSLSGFREVLILGCGSCVTVCLSGGDREARQLALELSRSPAFAGSPPVLAVDTIIRQCERDLVSAYQTLPPGTGAILSLACGCGVQTLGDVFEPLPVIPALNTTFYGASNEAGVWQEVCRGCGDCVLSYTGGICPVARCAKSLFNGPCGGSQNGSCEIYADVPCAWTLIYYRLKKQNKLHLLHTVRQPRDWRPAGAAGPRVRRRTGVGDGTGQNKIEPKLLSVPGSKVIRF